MWVKMHMRLTGDNVYDDRVRSGEPVDPPIGCEHDGVNIVYLIRGTLLLQEYVHILFNCSLMGLLLLLVHKLDCSTAVMCCTSLHDSCTNVMPAGPHNPKCRSSVQVR